METAEEPSNLAEVVANRRRCASFSEDYSVQKTNEDATESKCIAVQLGYNNDKFISCFVGACSGFSGGDTHRDPEILRGYWARTAAIYSTVLHFLEVYGSSLQIINLGAGFDTLYWRLKESGHRFHRFVEVDFSSVTSKKIHQIKRANNSVDLNTFFSEKAEEKQHCDLHAGDYHLIGADLRQLKEFQEKLSSANLDRTKPCLFIAECVFVYLDEQKTDELIAQISNSFDVVSFINYEQINTNDNFTKIMLENLNRRGIFLPGLSACETREKQQQRFLRAGFSSVQVLTMAEVYTNHLDQCEIGRIEKIQMLDEKELLDQLLEHYCLLLAVKDPQEKSAIKLLSI